MTVQIGTGDKTTADKTTAIVGVTRSSIARHFVVGLLALFASAVFANSASAASLRCDKAILQRGAHMYEVSELCGEPVAQFSRLEQRHPDVLIYVDEWVYRLGNNRFQRMLRFENGRLRSIRTLRKPRPEPYSGAGARQGAAEYRISY